MTEKQKFADRFRKHYREFITMEISFDDFCDAVFSEIDQPQQVSVEPEVKVNFADIKELFLMEIEKHDNIRMGAMLAKDIQAERTARENKKAIVDLFNKVESKISA